MRETLNRMIVRRARISDIPSIVQACLTSASPKETEGFAAPDCTKFSSVEELKKAWNTGSRLKDGSEVAVAEKGGEVLGFIVFSMKPDCAYIDDIDITKSEQRKGIGRALVTHVEEMARAHGRFRLETDTTENAEGVPWKSYGFWTRMGFKDTGERLPTKWSFKTIPFVKRLE